MKLIKVNKGTIFSFEVHMRTQRNCIKGLTAKGLIPKCMLKEFFTVHLYTVNVLTTEYSGVGLNNYFNFHIYLSVQFVSEI